MTISPTSAAVTVARALMEKALAAPKGIRVTQPTRADAERLMRSCHQARTAQRRVNKRVFAPDVQDVAPGETGGGRKGNDPDAIRTHFDDLVFWIEPAVSVTTEAGLVPRAPGDPDWPGPFVLVIAKPDLASLDIAEF